ncbi:hypothetical protein M9H77_28858 [Catharanthus roseus]|uniref:Uncharacterized protein n=1 Tax=Catharanthus roseus TaxID=4058 RepID=A0ACC0AIH7_CATRO|nr:hypothetical protein M9H77_28858 [Catharanthus roseus]
MSDNYAIGISTKEDDHEEESKKKPSIQGFWFPYQEHFEAQPNDIFVCSFPKTGTTWLKALAFAISTRNQVGLKPSPLLTNMPHECVPFLEFDPVHHDKRDPDQLPLFATHIPYDSLPKSIIESAGCKIIYICRDPKDTFVSLWYFLTKLTDTEVCFEKEFDLFCQGKSGFGPFWDHVLGFWKASLESPERILFLKYEDMKKDHNLFYVRRLAEFMNQPFTKEEEDKQLPKKIMDLCSFGNLSSLEVNKNEKYFAEFGIKNSAFFRKGEIGDWKNHLTKEMAETIDRISEEKLGTCGLKFGA